MLVLQKMGPVKLPEMALLRSHWAHFPFFVPKTKRFGIFPPNQRFVMTRAKQLAFIRQFGVEQSLQQTWGSFHFIFYRHRVTIHPSEDKG